MGVMPARAKRAEGEQRVAVPMRPTMARVLVVDDDLELQESLAEAIGLGGHEVSVASNGAEALDVLRSRHIDLVILDVMMPVMDGVQFRAEQKRDPAIAGIPVIVVSAASPIPKIDAAQILAKPVELRTLLSAVDLHARAAA
jgi:CheY-like chemotaxis protein